MNSSNIHSIEIIKGPASALYGAEAIGGVVNILTTPVPSKADAFISTQITNTGFKKLDLSWGAPTKTGGWMISAAFTDQKNGITEYSDFNKKALSVKRTFRVNEKLKGYQNLQYINYYTQMTGSLDSIKFFQKNFQKKFFWKKVKKIFLLAQTYTRLYKKSEKFHFFFARARIKIFFAEKNFFAGKKFFPGKNPD